MAIVTPTDRPKSVHNRGVIEVFGGVLCYHVAFLDFSVSLGTFFSSFFSLFEFAELSIL